MSRIQRPAYRYYAAGAIVHAIVGAAAFWLGYPSPGAGFLAVAGVLLLVAAVAWHRKTVIETTESRPGTRPTVLHNDAD